MLPLYLLLFSQAYSCWNSVCFIINKPLLSRLCAGLNAKSVTYVIFSKLT